MQNDYFYLTLEIANGNILIAYFGTSLRLYFPEKLSLMETKTMRKKICLLIVLALLTIPFSAMALTQDEVKSFVNEAATYAQKVGKEKALQEFMNKDGKFIRGELYIFAYSFGGNVLAHGAKPALVGKNLMRLVDANGVKVIQGLNDIAKTKGEGWLEYNWQNPVTKKIEPKLSYVVKVDDTYWIGAGMYK